MCGFDELIVAILNRSEDGFQRALMRRGSRIRESPANQLSAMHFAIYWPLALRELIDAGANINCEDSHGRRPIHLAVACRQSEAVEMLLRADCALYTPDYSNSLLQEALARGRTFDQSTEKIIEALVDRHSRLLQLAYSILPYESIAKLGLPKGAIWENLTPAISPELAAYHYPMPVALELDRDGEGVYDTADLHADIRLTVPLAEKLWNGGFRRVNEYAPINGLTPILQSWFTADFDMVLWFVDKGVSLFGKHRDAPISGLHLYAARLAYPGAHFRGRISAISPSAQHISQLMRDADSCRDSCSCLCSEGGCTPLSTLVKQNFDWRNIRQLNYETVLYNLRAWKEKMIYLPEEYPGHLEELLRSIVFKRLDLQHRCCEIGQLGEVGRWGRQFPGSPLDAPHDVVEEDFSASTRKMDRELEVCRRRMSLCQCPTAERPICAIFHDKCRGTETGHTE